METDRIVKSVLLRASRNRVWRALTDSAEFGSWFGVKFEGPFVAGTSIMGSIKPTTVDEEVAKAQKDYEGKEFNITVEELVPERLFSFRWRPFAVETNVDYEAEPGTLVCFTLEERSDGILLTVTESGFDQVPAERRAKAFEMNSHGWEAQMNLIAKYLTRVGSE